MTTLNPQLKQEQLGSRLEELKRTAFSFQCIDRWINKNLDAFGAHYAPTDEVTASLFSHELRNFRWNNEHCKGTLPAKVQINMVEDAQYATGVHHFFASTDATSYSNVLLMQQWVFKVEEWPFITVELLAHVMKDYSRTGAIPNYEKNALEVLLPLHFPGLTLERVLGLHHSGLFPETDGKVSPESLGPFLFASRNNQKPHDFAALPDDMTRPPL